MTIEFTDRYQALGTAYPDPSTMCAGQCEGTGVVPFHRDDTDASLAEQAAWQIAHARAHTLSMRIRMAWEFKSFGLLFERCDGFHFIECVDCGGSGLREHP